MATAEVAHSTASDGKPVKKKQPKHKASPPNADQLKQQQHPNDAAAKKTKKKKKKSSTGTATPGTSEGAAVASKAPQQGSPSPLKNKKKTPRKPSQPQQQESAVSQVPHTTHVVTRVTFFLNGDTANEGKQVAIDTRQTPTMDHLLDYLGEQLNPPWGAVMKVYNAESFKVIKDVSKFSHVTHAVAVGRNMQLKKIPYTDIQPYTTREQTYVPPDLSRGKSKVAAEVESRVHKPMDMKQIFVLVNGDEDGVGARVILRPFVLSSWDLVLKEITERVKDKLLFGSVQRLFTLEGLEVRDVHNLSNDSVYVAVDKMPLKLPPFTLSGGKLQRKPQKKVKLRPITKVEVPKRKEVVVAAFGRTGLGFLHDASVDVGEHRAFAGQGDGSSGSSTDPDAQPPVTVHRMQNSDDAMLAVDEIVRSIITSRALRTDSDAVDNAIFAIIRRARERLLEHRQMAPDVTTAFDDQIEEVLQFMLKAEEREAHASARDVAERFEPLVQAAVAGRLAHWESTPSSFVALVILLDQFPRTIYRGTQDMFQGDRMARAVILRGLFNSSIMDELHPVYRVFPCIALSHQEDVQMQRLCIAEWEKTREFFDEDDPIRDYTTKFEHNLSVIEQFGRFPERNALAGRKPRRAEQEYLSSNGLARQLPRDSSSVSLQTNLGRLKLFEASQPDGSHREGQPLSGVAQ